MSSSSGLLVEIPLFRSGFIHLIYGLLAFPDIEDVFPRRASGRLLRADLDLVV